MERGEALQALRRMTAAWRTELTDDEARLRLDYLVRHDASLVAEALANLEQSLDRFPTIHQLQEACRQVAQRRALERGLSAGREQPTLLADERQAIIREVSETLASGGRREHTHRPGRDGWMVCPVCVRACERGDGGVAKQEQARSIMAGWKREPSETAEVF